jgi:hypothetical protein
MVMIADAILSMLVAVIVILAKEKMKANLRREGSK